MTSRSSRVLTTDVYDPTGVAWYYNKADGTSRFYVGQYNSKNVKIFDGNWAVIGTIQKCFSQVTGVIISPVNTLWVADRMKNQVFEFDFDGNFIRIVLSDVKGVRSMSYHPLHPSFVWITQIYVPTKGYNAKRIKIY